MNFLKKEINRMFRKQPYSRLFFNKILIVIIMIIAYYTEEFL